MSRCEAELYRKTTSRISYGLMHARNLCEVKQVIELIDRLFSTSAMEENALAEVIKSYCSCLKVERCHSDCCSDEKNSKSFYFWL